ncbi:MAG TPA: glycosyltransferase family 87 protein, partial [Rhizomicrobium sp.]
MSHLLSLLRNGDYLTRERARLWAGGFLIAFAAAILFLALTAQGLNDYKNRPLGTDFSNVYAAGTLTRDGVPGTAYDPARQYERERAVFGADTPFYGWHYPPFFLAVADALSALPYLPALILWQGATLALVLLAMARLLRGVQITQGRTWLLYTLAFP